MPYNLTIHNRILRFLWSHQATIEGSLLWYFTAVNLLYTLFLCMAFYKVMRRSRETLIEERMPLVQSNSLPSILFVIPCHNEGPHILDNVHNILALSYRYKRIVIVNDGSTDNSTENLQKELELIPIPRYYSEPLSTQPVKNFYRSKKYPDVFLIDKEHGGKFDAMNAAINAIDSSFFVILDADTFIDGQQFETLVRPILTTGNAIAIGAGIRIMNGCTFRNYRIQTTNFPQKFLPAAQGLDYLRAFCLRNGLDVINGNCIIAGAFSIFPRDIIIQCGGFAPSPGEDVEIIIRLHRIFIENKKPYRIQYFPDPVAYTIAPETVKDLGKQRTRWHLGLLESLWFHKRIFFNPRYGIFGLFSLPFWFVAEAIEPLAELIGLLYLIIALCFNILDLYFFLFFVAVTVGYMILYGLYALALEEFSFRKFPSLKSLTMLSLVTIIENFGYRQLNFLWRMKGIWQFLGNGKELRRVSALIRALVLKARNNLDSPP